MIASSICFDSHVWTQMSDITRATYEYFDLLARCCVCLPVLWHNFDIFFITLPLSFGILIFQLHIIACFISFDTHVWTQKCDITRATYEHFDSLTRSCVCVHQLWENFGIFFITRPLSFQILTFKFHMIASFIKFDSHVWTQKSDITRATYEYFDLLTRSSVSLPQLLHNFGIFFTTRPLSFEIFFQIHMLACFVSFDLHVWI